MTAVWPLSFAQYFLADGFDPKLMPNTYESTPTGAAGSSAKIFSAVPFLLAGKVPFKESQLADFNTWYQTTLDWGVEKFQWTQPIPGLTTTSCEMQFCRAVNPNHYTLEYVGGVRWRIAMGLVILP